MTGTRTDVGEAKLLEDACRRARMKRDAEPLGDDLLAGPPGASARRHSRRDPDRSRRPARTEPVAPPKGEAGHLRPVVDSTPPGPPFIEAMDPVPQRPARSMPPILRRHGPVHPIPDRRSDSRRRLSFASFEAVARRRSSVGRKVRPHRHRCRHGTNPPAPWNRLEPHREGNRRQRERKAVGIIAGSLRGVLHGLCRSSDEVSCHNCPPELSFACVRAFRMAVFS